MLKILTKSGQQIQNNSEII